MLKFCKFFTKNAKLDHKGFNFETKVLELVRKESKALNLPLHEEAFDW
jgi:hypothetical protein